MTDPAPTYRVDDPTPAGRRDRLVALAAIVFPGLAASVESEPSDDLGGPWESATWTRGARRLRVTCFPAATQLTLYAGLTPVAAELFRDPREAPASVLARLVWLMEG